MAVSLYDHARNPNGNCEACSQLWTGSGDRVVAPYPCPIMEVERLRRDVATLRQQVAILSADDAMRTGELREECDHLRRQIALSRRRRIRERPTGTGALLQAAAIRCVDLMELRLRG